MDITPARRAYLRSGCSFWTITPSEWPTSSLRLEATMMPSASLTSAILRVLGLARRTDRM